MKDLSYVKDKYFKVEMSFFEAELILAALSAMKSSIPSNAWFTERHVEDVYSELRQLKNKAQKEAEE